MSYYGYERLRPGDALGIDMATVTKSLSDDLKAYEQKKADDAAGVATTSREFAELLGKMPTSFNQEYNRFFGDTSQAAMQSASKVNQQFNNGDIDKRTYDILMANLNSQVSMTVDSMTKYATMVNDIEEKKAAGELSDYDLFKLSQLQKFSDLGNVSIAFDPNSYQASLIKVGEGIKGGYEVMPINQYFNGVNMKFQGQYDTAGAINSTLKNFAGERDITTAQGKQEVGAFIQTNEGKSALKNAAQAMLSQPTALRGFATANTIYNIDEKGNLTDEVVEFNYATTDINDYTVGGYIPENELKKLQDKNPYLFYEDLSGRLYESDKGKEIILKNAEQMLRGAADYTLVEPKSAKVISKEPSVDQLLSTVRAITGTGAKPPAALIELVLDEAGLSQEEINKFKTDYNAEGTSDTSQIITDAYSWLQSNLRDKSFGENVDKTVEGIQPVLFAFGYDVVKKDDGSIDVLDGEDLIYNIKENDDKAFINLYNKIAGQQKRTGITLAYSSAKLANPSIAKKKLPGQ
jgi:hypothetical protein